MYRKEYRMHHKVRRNYGNFQVKLFEEWEEISEEEFYELLSGGYELEEDDLLLEGSNSK